MRVVKHWHRLPREVGRCPIPRNIQHEVGQRSEQPDLVVDVPAHCRRFGLEDIQRSLPTKLFYDSLIL